MGTDTASCVQRFTDLPVRWVPGDERNLKITYPHDARARAERACVVRHTMRRSTVRDEGSGTRMADLEPRNFLQPCLLLLLAERADHGYELATRLRPLHDGEGDSGGVYRALRGLEKHGLVRSEWRTSDVGPARRTYHITAGRARAAGPPGAELQHVHDVLHLFLERYAGGVRRQPARPAPGRRGGCAVHAQARRA